MDKEAFEGLIDLKLSVATTKAKADGTPESYIGFLERVGEDFIILDYSKATTNKNNTISKVIIANSIIMGIWVYE